METSGSETESESKLCPRCSETGTSVKEITLRSLLHKEAQNSIAGAKWRFCGTPDCDVVYFDEGGKNLHEKNALTVRVGIKETSAPRPVCYCFDHTIEEIESDLARTGSTGVLDDIKTRMKTACWCETKSPKGSCCLGTVTRVVGQLQAHAGEAAPESATARNGNPEEEIADCCLPSSEALPDERSPSTGSHRRFGRFATVGAMVSAVLSSVCCWLPLVVLAFGGSIAGLAQTFEQWRGWFLGGAFLLLGAAFYFSYSKKACCDSESGCETSGQKIQRFNRAMLWMAAVFVVAMTLFPNLLTSLSGGSERSADASELAALEGAIVLPIQGMTCEACAVSLQSRLAAVPGTQRVAVDYEGKRAVVLSRPDSSDLLAEIRRGVEESGYSIAEEEGTER